MESNKCDECSATVFIYLHHIKRRWLKCEGCSRVTTKSIGDIEVVFSR